MSKINKDFANILTSYLVEIAHGNLSLTENQILEEDDEVIQEILFGLFHLDEELKYNTKEAEKVTNLIREKERIQRELVKSEKSRVKNLEHNQNILNSRNKLLEQQNTELEHFAYLLSHDLVAPLIAINGLIHFIEEDLTSKDNKAVFEHLKKLKERVCRMEKLIKGIEDFASIAMSNTKSELIQLNELALTTYKELHPPKNFSFNITTPLPEIEGIRPQFRQLFKQLISNSIKHNPKEKKKLIIDYHDLGEQHEIHFKDNGPGIDSNYHDKIFTAFQTLNNAQHHENTGIGLSIVKKIVGSMNGKILLNSEVSKGATFVVQFPKYT